MVKKVKDSTRIFSEVEHDYPKDIFVEIYDSGAHALVVRFIGNNRNRSFRLLLTKQQLIKLIAELQEATSE